MSPQAALGSRVFALYVSLVVTVAIVSWISIRLLRRFAGRDVSHAAQSYRAWLIMAPLVLAAIFLGRVTAIFFIFGLALLGFWEYARATLLVRDRLLVGALMVSIAALAGDVALAERLRPSLDWLKVYLAMPLVATAFVVCIPVVRNRTTGELQRITLAVFG